MDGPTTAFPPSLPAAMGRPGVPRLSASALEVLGAVAPFGISGPHRPDPLRRHTRLTPLAFKVALLELERGGLVRFEETALWTTADGESLANAVFS